jgi:CheY-like chemotaxis protein
MQRKKPHSIAKKATAKKPAKPTKKTFKIILIVEDDRSLLKGLGDSFEREGIEVLTATNGEEGLKMALKKKPNLIILDILMPVMDGMTMLKKLRKDKWGKEVFVIILTNKGPDYSLSDEAETIPYRSCYLMKSDYNLAQIVKFAKDKINPKKHSTTL